MITVDDLRFFTQVVVVVLGWTVVHYLSVARDRNKLRLEMIVRSIDGAWELSDKLLLAALDYHANVRHLGHERDFKAAFQDLILRTVSFVDLCSNVQEIAICRNAVLSMRLCVTGEHFEGAHELPIDESSPQFWEMADQTMRVKRAFLRLKHRQYAQR